MCIRSVAQTAMDKDSLVRARLNSNSALITRTTPTRSSFLSNSHAEVSRDVDPARCILMGLGNSNHPTDAPVNEVHAEKRKIHRQCPRVSKAPLHVVRPVLQSAFRQLGFQTEARGTYMKNPPAQPSVNTTAIPINRVSCSRLFGNK